MLKRLVILFAGIVLASACSAKDPQTPTAAARYTQGDQYLTIAQPQRLSDKGKVEVVEVFSYGCPHCAHFTSYVEKLRKSLPQGVVFHLVPASFSPAWEPYARAFYAAQELGVVDRTHLDLFRAKFQQNYALNSLDDLADFYAREGVDRAAFLRAANSAETDRKLAHDTALLQTWKVSGTPTMVVDGKYVSNQVHSFDELIRMTRWMIDRELKAKGG